MLFVPLPFVVALLLMILFAVRVWRGEQTNMPFMALILICAVLSVLMGLRWGYGWQGAVYVSPVLAACVPPLAYAGVVELAGREHSRSPLNLALHALPAFVILVLLVTGRNAIDLALPLIFAGYALAILMLMQPGTDSLRRVPFEGAPATYRAILFAAGALLLSAGVDIAVALDMTWTHGEHAATIVTLANLANLVILAIAAAASSPPAAGDDALPARDQTEDDRATLAALDDLMEARRLYRDADLTLDRLARRAGIPARQISTAINRAKGCNVSQYVNDRRIAEACTLLATTPRSVTEIMFEAGFQTKSNFNREFRRVTGMAPMEWRKTNRTAATKAA